MARLTDFRFRKDRLERPIMIFGQPRCSASHFVDPADPTRETRSPPKTCTLTWWYSSHITMYIILADSPWDKGTLSRHSHPGQDGLFTHPPSSWSLSVLCRAGRGSSIPFFPYSPPTDMLPGRVHNSGPRYGSVSWRGKATAAVGPYSRCPPNLGPRRRRLSCLGVGSTISNVGLGWNQRCHQQGAHIR